MNNEKSGVRKRAELIKPFRCKNLITVVENSMDIKNIGTIIRNVNALGVDKVYVVDSRKSLSDEWEKLRENQSLLKTSVSASKWTFVKRFNSTVECFEHLKSNDFVSIATSPHPKAKENAQFDLVDYTKYKKLAVWFGNESAGISDYAVEHSEMCVSIPMFGIIESLNLGTSSGIVLYEIAKQRREYQNQVFSKKLKNKNSISSINISC